MLSRSHSHSLLIAHPSHQYTRNKNGMKKKEKLVRAVYTSAFGPDDFFPFGRNATIFSVVRPPEDSSAQVGEIFSVLCYELNTCKHRSSLASPSVLQCEYFHHSYGTKYDTKRNTRMKSNKKYENSTMPCFCIVHRQTQLLAEPKWMEKKRKCITWPSTQQRTPYTKRRYQPYSYTFYLRMTSRSPMHAEPIFSFVDRRRTKRNELEWTNDANQKLVQLIEFPEYRDSTISIETSRLEFGEKNDGYFPRTANPDVDRVLEISINRKVCIWRPYGYMVQWLVAQRLKKLS